MVNWIKLNNTCIYFFYILLWEKIKIKICRFTKYEFIMKGQGVISFTIWGGGSVNITSPCIYIVLQSSDYFKTCSRFKCRNFKNRLGVNTLFIYVCSLILDTLKLKTWCESPAIRQTADVFRNLACFTFLTQMI